MTKRDLIEVLVDECDHLQRRDVEALVHSVFDVLSDALVDGERIEIRGFGSFVLKNRDARRGLNPRTGESVDVPAKRVPFFKAGKELRVRVDEGREAPAAATPDAAAPDAAAPQPLVAETPGENH